MNVTLVRGRPIALTGYAHIELDGKQLCAEPVHQPIEWDRSDVWEARDVCGVCTRALLKALHVPQDVTETVILRLVRGDYDPTNPNKFWREFGVTQWSRVE